VCVCVCVCVCVSGASVCVWHLQLLPPNWWTRYFHVTSRGRTDACACVSVMQLAAMNVVNKMLTHDVQEMGTAAQEREQCLAHLQDANRRSTQVYSIHHPHSVEQTQVTNQ
jgi:hypothetical protein